MEEFNNCSKYPETLKLKDLEIGKYKLLSLKKIQTKFGNTVIAELEIDDEIKNYFLSKSTGKLSDKAIKEINNGNYFFHYEGKINDKYYKYHLLKKH